MKNVPGAFPGSQRYSEGMRSITAHTTAASTLPVSALPISALPRPLDFSFPSNRAAVYGAAMFGALALLLGRSWRQALGLAGVTGLVQTSARQTGENQTGQNQTGQAHTGQDRARQSRGAAAPAILPALAVLSSVRLLTGTVGYAATRPDTLALSVQAGAAALAGYPVAAALPAAALALSAAEQDTLRPYTEWGAALALGAGLLPRITGRITPRAGSAG